MASHRRNPNPETIPFTQDTYLSLFSSLITDHIIKNPIRTHPEDRAGESMAMEHAVDLYRSLLAKQRDRWPSEQVRLNLPQSQKHQWIWYIADKSVFIQFYGPQGIPTWFPYLFGDRLGQPRTYFVVVPPAVAPQAISEAQDSALISQSWIQIAQNATPQAQQVQLPTSQLQDDTTIHVQTGQAQMVSIPPGLSMNSFRSTNFDLYSRVVEKAVREALNNSRYPTAYALRTLFNDHRANIRIVGLIESIYLERATDEQRVEFNSIMKHKKKEARKDRIAEFYFNGDRSDPASARPPIAQFASASTALAMPASAPASGAVIAPSTISARPNQPQLTTSNTPQQLSTTASLSHLLPSSTSNSLVLVAQRDPAFWQPVPSDTLVEFRCIPGFKNTLSTYPSQLARILTFALQCSHDCTLKSVAEQWHLKRDSTMRRWSSASPVELQWRLERGMWGVYIGNPSDPAEGAPVFLGPDMGPAPSLECWNCQGKDGHMWISCRRACFNCGQYGHSCPACRDGLTVLVAGDYYVNEQQ